MVLGWVPFTLVLFAHMRPRQAAVISLIFGWLFLPQATYALAGLPDYSKITATCFPIILGTLLFDGQRCSKLRLGTLDIPIIVWCCCALASSISNGLGIYDGISGVLRQIFQWGFPYAIGKMYFSDKEGLRDLAMGIVIGGLVYIPFCLWEMRMSPNLHYYIYGFRADKFINAIRFGAYRPVVFLQHGIAVGVWMMSALLMGIWLWRSKAVRFLHGFSMGFIVCALFVVFLLCRSLNAIILFVGGIFAYYVIRSWRWKSIVLCLAIIPVFYIVSRNNGMLSADILVGEVSSISEDRSRSLYGRLYHEEKLQEKAWRRPLFGWGGWGRNRIYDEDGNDISVTDGLWIIVFGTHGLVGLISLGFVFLLPSLLFWRKYRFADWGQADLAPMAGFACVIPLYVIDCLMNAMVNPVFTVAAGGMLGWLASKENIPAN